VGHVLICNLTIWTSQSGSCQWPFGGITIDDIEHFVSVLDLSSYGDFLAQSVKKSGLGDSGLSLLDPLQHLIPAAVVPCLEQLEKNWAIGLGCKMSELAPVVPFVFDGPRCIGKIYLCNFGMFARKKLVKLM
jgi:hypothetical protein